jgi:hypothetical protein
MLGSQVEIIKFVGSTILTSHFLVYVQSTMARSTFSRLILGFWLSFARITFAAYHGVLVLVDPTMSTVHVSLF